MGSDPKQTQNTRQNSTATNSPYGPAESGINNILQQAQGIAPQDFSQFQPGIENLLSGILGGGDNPYNQQLINSITDASRNAVGGAFSAAGRSFSPSHAAALGKSVTNSLAPYAYQDYRNSISQLPGLLGTAANLPYAGLQGQSNLLLPIASQFGTQQTQGKGTSTTTQSTNPFQTALGGGLGLLGLGLSPMSGGFGGTALGGLLGY